MSLTYKGSIKDFKNYIATIQLIFGNITVKEVIRKINS